MDAQRRLIFLLLGISFGIKYVKAQDIENPLVMTPLGIAKGRIFTSRLGKSIYSFTGIRYAKPPIDELRFQPPVPIDKWENTYDATEDGPLCPQPVLNDTISEDCLTLNVYTTKLPKGEENTRRPVIVYIHPGGFYALSGVRQYNGPQYLLDQDIVLVTFNYRIGALGFLSTGDKEAPGNYGLKDQVEVLKWVNRNIASFGGDPNSVTLLGYSAGAWSVILHMVSQMSKGLFHKAISMSGSPLTLKPLPEGSQLDNARKQASLVGCLGNDTTINIVKCLKNVPYVHFANTLLDFREYGYLFLPWIPVVEPDCGQTRFLTDQPLKLIVNGKFQHVPLINGRTKDEFSYIALEVLNNQTLLSEFNNDFETVAPVVFGYERGTPFSRKVSRSIREFYFHNKPIDRSNEQALKDLYEDTIVGIGSHLATKVLEEYCSAPVYYYRFSYQGRYSYYYLPETNNTIPYGVVHHDDLIYLIYNSGGFPLFTENDPEARMVDQLTTLVANFARTGNPTPERSSKLNNIRWHYYDAKDKTYLDIGNQLVLRQGLHERRFQEWEKLFPVPHPRYNRY